MGDVFICWCWGWRNVSVFYSLRIWNVNISDWLWFRKGSVVTFTIEVDIIINSVCRLLVLVYSMILLILKTNCFELALLNLRKLGKWNQPFMGGYIVCLAFVDIYILEMKYVCYKKRIEMYEFWLYKFVLCHAFLILDEHSSDLWDHWLCLSIYKVATTSFSSRVDL